MRFALPALLLYTSLTLAADPWSLQPVKRPDPPALDEAGKKWAKSPIDHFIWAKLAERKLTPNGPADPRSLLRRVFFDLIGLPPSPGQIEAFAKNPTDAAYAKIVDELLASPHYGERWARYWLDVGRYGESDGFERNAQRLTAWHYRDWVIKALNADLPFDQFAKLQLAGDVLDPDGDGVKATGFLVAGIHNTVLGSNKIANATARQDELEDVIATVGQTFIGLTVQCARCHDHKFDPVDQGDYYRLVATLGGVTHGERTTAKKSSGPPEKVFATVSMAVPATHILSRGSVEKPKKEVLPGGVACVPGESDFDLTAKATDGERRKKLAEWIARADNPLFTRVIVNRLWHHHFGVGIVDTPSDFGANGGKPTHPELLDWLAAELVAPTASGTAGVSRPGGGSSTQLADAGGSSRTRPAPWSLKHLHRLIVLSAAYRQSSVANPTAAMLDADNRLLWRKSATRLEAEAVRDAILAVSGDLDRTVGGPPFHDVKTYENNGTTYYQPLDALPANANRRTVYRFSPRGERNAVLETFDCPDPSAQTPRRQTTTTPLQALALWNDAFVLRTADRFAERVTTDCQRGSVEEKVKRAYRLAIGREPTADEAKPAAALVEKHGLKALGRVLFNCSEFVVVE